MAGVRPLALVFALVLSGGCASNHHVSEWGDLGRPDLMLYAEQPDITTHLAEIDNDESLRGMSRDHELTANVRGTQYVTRSFVGSGPLGRTLHAIRVATPSGVVLALGPLATADNLRHEPCELVVSLVGPPPLGGGPFASMTDLTGSGALGLIARSEDGILAVYTLSPYGAARLDAAMEVPPTEVADVDADGHLDLRGRVRVDDDDPLKPDLVDVATFDGARYANGTKAARAFHAMLRDERSGDPPPSEPAARLRRALERAWHAILAGDDAAKALEKLDEEKPPRELAGAFASYRRRLEKITVAAPLPRESAKPRR